MSTQAFTDVSLRRDDSAAEDKGNLTIHRDSIQFDGRAEQLRITDIQYVSIGKPPGFVFGDWVKVEYGNGFEPSIAYVRGKSLSGEVERIYAAMQHFPNSNQFECTVWTSGNRRMLRPAPRKPGGFASPRKGIIAMTRTDVLTLSMQRMFKREIPLTDIEGSTHGILTARQQFTSKLLELLITGAAVGVFIAVAMYIVINNNAALSAVDALTNIVLVLAATIALVVIGGLLLSLPSLLRTHTVDLYTLKFTGGRQWEFGVNEQQSEQVAKTLQSWGTKSRVP